MNRFTLVVLATVLCAACASTGERGAATTPVGGDQGFVQFVVRDWPAEAKGIRVFATGAALVSASQGGVPLDLRLQDLRLDAVGRVLALGAVPQGHYTALELTVTAANRRGEQRDEALPLAENQVRVPLDLQLMARQGVVVEVELDPRSVPSGEAAFRPAFTAHVPPKPTLGAMGIAACPNEARLAFFDKRDGHLGAIVPTGRQPRGLALDRDNQRLYVALAGEDALEVVDLSRVGVVERRVARVGDEPVDVQLTPDASALLVVNRRSNSLSFVEARGLAEITRVNVGNGPRSVLVDGSGQKAYVFNADGASVTVVDVPARSVMATIAVDSGPVRGQFNRSQDRLWVLHEGSPFLTSIDPRSLQVAQRLQLGAGATAFRVDPRTDRIYAARRDGTGIDVYDAFSPLPIEVLPLPGPVAYLALDSESYEMVAACGDAGEVRAMGVVARRAAWNRVLGCRPEYLVIAGER